MQGCHKMAPWNQFKPSSKIFYWQFQGGTSFVDLLCVFFCLVFPMPLGASVYMCLVVTCWERADLWPLVCGVWLWVCHFPIGILGQVLYLIVLIPDLCTLTYGASDVPISEVVVHFAASLSQPCNKAQDYCMMIPWLSHNIGKTNMRMRAPTSVIQTPCVFCSCLARPCVPCSSLASSKIMQNSQRK